MGAVVVLRPDGIFFGSLSHLGQLLGCNRKVLAHAEQPLTQGLLALQGAGFGFK
jgi:hypothetical protein